MRNAMFTTFSQQIISVKLLLVIIGRVKKKKSMVSLNRTNNN